MWAGFGRMGVHAQPVFPHPVWGVRDRTLAGKDRTNNFAEAFHRNMQLSFASPCHLEIHRRSKEQRFLEESDNGSIYFVPFIFPYNLNIEPFLVVKLFKFIKTLNFSTSFIQFVSNFHRILHTLKCWWNSAFWTWEEASRQLEAPWRLRRIKTTAPRIANRDLRAKMNQVSSTPF